INLITALFHIYKIEIKSDDYEAFIRKLIEFYHKLNTDENPVYSSKIKLETLIHHRVFIDDSIITKTFTKVLTNSLLFIDVLAFKMYIISDEHPTLHAKRLENI